MCPTGVGSGDTTPLIAHTAGDRSQSTVRNFSVATAVSPPSLGLSPPMAGGDPVQDEEQNEYGIAGEVLSVLSAGRDPAQENLNNKSQTTQRLPAAGEPPSIATAREWALCKVQVVLFDIRTIDSRLVGP